MFDKFIPPSTIAAVKEFLSMVFTTKFYHAIFLLILMVVTVKIVDLIFAPFRRNTHKIHLVFLNNVIRVFIIISFLLRIGSLSETFSQFFSSILMSSSLIVVVLGFVFQEGLANMVHGFMLIMSKPFNIGDRVKVTIDGQAISGYVKNINLQNTIIQTISNNTMVIIPNAKMDMCVIDNSYFDAKAVNSNFLDVTVTYESDIDHAMEIIGEVIAAHPMVKAARPAADQDKPVNVLVSDLQASAVLLRASVVTNTVEENFQACSDIRRELLKRFAADPAVDMAYPHMQIVQ